MNDWTRKKTEEALRSDDWQAHMTFSPLRESLFNWYEFLPDGHLLELNAGRGALTGLFCDRCRSVTALTGAENEEDLRRRYDDRENLTIRTGSWNDWEEGFSGAFDYVVVTGLLEKEADPADALHSWVRFLKEDGRLLLTVENRFGLKYFCGAADPFTGIPFDGPNGYFRGSDRGKCLSRDEICLLMDGEEGLGYRFFYPVPDSRMPQMIFSDEYMKGVNAAERLVDYNYEDPSMMVLEHRIFSRMIDAGALPFLADSFLIEAGRKENLSDIIYAVTTSDRGPVYSCATTIRRNGTVRKRPLRPEGESNIRNLQGLTEELLERRVPVVPARMDRDRYGIFLEMPYISEESLSSAVHRLAVEDPQACIRIFDEIFYWICLATQPSGKASGVTEKPRLILEKAFLDLAPCNGFYIGDGSLLFYDQEFVMEDCPLTFAMYRTLKYCYLSDPGLEEKIPLRSLQKRYGISEDDAEEFDKKEDAFIRSVRDLERYQQLFQWARPDHDTIRSRQTRLMEADGKAEKDRAGSGKAYRTGYVPGVFDLFHAGHLNLLEKCKERCDYLIVGVLTDELVEYYKGHGCVISWEDRARILEALEIVDEVIPVDFSNTDKLDAWEQLHYDCHFSGDDHLGHWDDIMEALRERGSNMEFFPYTQGVSSTRIRSQLKEKD